MITADGWFDWMDRNPGPADKVYNATNTMERFFSHDAVGYLQGWYSRLFSTARQPNGRYTPYAAASVHGWNPYEHGVAPIQFYPVTKSCWASGGRIANTTGIAFENASWDLANTPDWYHPAPQSDWQVECTIRELKDIAEFTGRPLSYWTRPTSPTDISASLYLHKETIRFGHPYTSCDNFRTRWSDILAGLVPVPPEPEEEDMFTPEDKTWLTTEIERLIAAGTDSKRMIVKLEGLPHVYHLDRAQGRLVHDVNLTAFLAAGGEFADLITLDWSNPDHAEIGRLAILYPSGLRDLEQQFKPKS